MNLPAEVLDVLEASAKTLAAQLREDSEDVEGLTRMLEGATGRFALHLNRLSAHAEVLAAHGRLVPVIPPRENVNMQAPSTGRHEATDG